MVLIDTNNNFDDYLTSLSRHARKDYAYVKKHNADLVYSCIPFDRELVERFMRLWATQLVRGNPIEWAFGIGYIEDLANRGELLLFRGGDLALHFIQKRTGFWECHPPMYDKKHSHRYLAKFMWFNLIKYAMDSKMEPLDMGGGVDNWHEMIRRKDEFPNPKYKWRYVPTDVQQHPKNYPNYLIESINGERILRKIT